MSMARETKSYTHMFDPKNYCTHNYLKIYINGRFISLSHISKNSGAVKSENIEPNSLSTPRALDKETPLPPYADDLVIFSTTPDGLQKSLDVLQSFYDDFKLEVNYKKTKCMTFGEPHRKIYFQIKKYKY